MATQIHTVTHELRRRLMTGAYAPGARLVELQLSAELGASRTPIRLAFEELAREGWLERLPTRGFRVLDIRFRRSCTFSRFVHSSRYPYSYP